jgi:ribonuclease J
VTQDKGIDVLLMEGTHVGSGRETGPTEFELEEQVVELVTNAPGLVLAAFSPVDVDRLVTFYRSAQRTGRVFVADAYAAFVLHLVASDTRIPRPTREAGIKVFYNRAFEQRNIDKLQQLFAQDRIDLDEVLSHPSRHLMVFRPSMTKLDFEGKIPTQSRCIYSYWAGYLKNPDWVELQQQLKEAGGDFCPAHASGHIYVRDLIEFVGAVNAKMVIPIHTFEPDEFRNHFGNVRVLQDGQQYEIE